MRLSFGSRRTVHQTIGTPQWRPVVVSLLVAASSLAATLSPAAAAYPGASNGMLAFAIKGADGNPQINVVQPDGSGVTALTSGAYFHACAAFSADGMKIAYCSNESGAFEIWTMNADGSDQAQLTKLGGMATFPDYSPDGTMVTFGGTQPTDAHTEILTVDSATGASVTALTSCADGKPGCSNDFPAWSPDGSRIAWIHVGDRDADDNPIRSQVWVMDADGSNAHALTTDTAIKDQLPDWSPDGSQIAYHAGSGGSGGIWVMNADGSDPQQLIGCTATEPSPCATGDFGGPTWSPDGQEIAFLSFPIDPNDRPVMIMNADGSNPHRVIAGPSIDFVPAWQPVGVAAAPSASGSTGPSSPAAFSSSTFDIPISLVLDDGWVVEKDRATDIDLQRGDQDAGISTIASMTVPGTASGDPRMPWPDDLYAWLDSRPEFTPMAPRNITVGGRPAILIDAHEDVPEGTRIDMFCVANNTCWLAPAGFVDHNDWWRFVEVKDADGSGIIAITNGSADMYDASTGALDLLLATLAFR